MSGYLGEGKVSEVYEVDERDEAKELGELRDCEATVESRISITMVNQNTPKTVYSTRFTSFRRVLSKS